MCAGAHPQESTLLGAAEGCVPTAIPPSRDFQQEEKEEEEEEEERAKVPAHLLPDPRLGLLS